MGKSEFLKDYELAVQEIESLGKIFEKDMRKTNAKFSAEYFCFMFETLMQYSLLELSPADNDVSEEEIGLIEGISKYADIVDLGNIFLKTNYVWADFVDADPEFVKSWLKKIDRSLDMMQSTFVLQFAAFDSKASGDSLAKVMRGLIGMFTVFIGVDENRSEEEVEAVMNCKMIKTLSDILNVMNQ